MGEQERGSWGAEKQGLGVSGRDPSLPCSQTVAPQGPFSMQATKFGQESYLVTGMTLSSLLFLL